MHLKINSCGRIFLPTFLNLIDLSLPSNWVNMKELIYLNISHNELTGTFPVGMKDFVDLVEFDVGHNNFDGPIYDEYSSLKKMRIFDISSNMITGTIPKSWTSMTDLQYFRADNNKLTGTLSSEWEDIPYLIEVRLNDNNICGPIPDWLYSRVMIHVLTLRNNEWYCPLDNYCRDSQKIECDYSEDMVCLKEQLHANGENICVHNIQSSMPTWEPSKKPTTSMPTNDPTTPIPTISPSYDLNAAGMYFHTAKVYTHARCNPKGDNLLKLPDISGHVGCGNEVWHEPRCGHWYFHDPLGAICFCVLKGAGCHKTADKTSTVYKIISGSALKRLKMPDLEKERNDENVYQDLKFTGNHLTLILIFAASASLGAMVQHFFCKRANPNYLDDILLA